MAYVLPQVRVFQEFSATPAPSAAPRNAHVSGGHADLHRYTEPAEKASTLLGEYDPSLDTDYTWPHRTAGAAVDLSFVKLYVENGKLLYFEDPASSGSVTAPVAGRRNRVRSAGFIFKTSEALGTTYGRSADFFDRDVKVGDLAYVSGTVLSVQYSLNTSVIGFVGDLTTAVVDAVTDGDSNQASATTFTNIDKLAGPDNCITLTADGSAYDGRQDGDITETYTVEVTQSSTSGDLTTARLRVTSASGNDNQSSVTPRAAGGFTAIGTRGLEVEFDITGATSCSSAAGLDDASPGNLIAGQKWRIRVGQNFTPPVGTSGGSYLGLEATTYIVEVTKGGAFSDSPQITVSTTTGVDISGPTTVTAASTAVTVGSQGVTISFTGVSGLRAGDKYYIEVEPSVEGPLRTLVFADDLPDELLAATDLDLRLYINYTGEVSVNMADSAPSVNYTKSATNLTVNSGIQLFESTWTDGGVLMALPLEGGTLYAHYRAWLSTYCTTVESVQDVGSIPDLLGTVHPDNPLAWGVSLALQNSNGIPVRFTSVCNPDSLTSWLGVLDVLFGRDDVYNLVPLTFRRDVQDAFSSHATTESNPENGLWRACVFAVDVQDLQSILDDTTSSDQGVVLASLGDDPHTAGTQYTLLSVPANNAKFRTLGVRAGDTVRYLYTADGFGNATYSEFEVDEVLSENSLVVLTGHPVAITVPQKVEIWRNLSATERAHEIALQVGAFSSRRVVCLPNSTVVAGGFTCAGYFAACLIAGLRSGVQPNQGLTHVEITGLEGAGDPVTTFNAAQLDTIANSGGWIIIQTVTGQFITRHALTTDVSDLNHRNEMIRVNLDSISYVCRQVLEPYIGRANVAPEVLRQIAVDLKGALVSLQQPTAPLLGPQVVSFNLVDLRQHAVFKDRVVAVVNLVLPYDLDNIDLRLVI